ncbi:carbonic anhydrase [Entophlyctis helioformis]|nr:carbonic anhydrase [Entophlyctis helioformis]
MSYSRGLDELLERNRQWAAETRPQDKLPKPRDYESQFQDSPSVFWIGCADSRVPPNEIIRLGTGQMSVHRNIANVVSVSDVNLLADLEIMIHKGKVPTIILCGHYNCGGVAASLSTAPHGLIDNWLLHIRQVHTACKPMIELISDEKMRLRALVELNVIYGAAMLAQTPAVKDAWKAGMSLTIHSWAFDIGTGEIRHVASIRSAAGMRALPVALT